VLADDQQAAPLGSESSPFARLESEQAAAAEAQAAPAATVPAGPSAEAPFRSEPQELVSSGASEPPTGEPRDEEEPGEVDRVMLAKEFSGLLQLGEDGDED
jgi:hypothetical protein